MAIEFNKRSVLFSGFIFCLLFLATSSSYAQRLSKDEIFTHFVSDKEVQKALRFEADSIDTLNVIDMNFLLGDTIITRKGTPLVVLKRKTELSMLLFHMRGKEFIEEAKKWRKTVWLKSINICGDTYSITCYYGYRNMGGQVVYKLKKGKLIGNYDLGSF